MSKKKKIVREYNPSAREPRSTATNRQIIDDSLQHCPAWQFGLVDRDHKEWGWNNIGDNDPSEIFEKLKGYESRKWHEIRKDKKRDHSVNVELLSPAARKRLKELKLDDNDSLFRFRFKGKLRIWGILEGYKFYILWLDPNHTVCPSSER